MTSNAIIYMMIGILVLVLILYNKYAINILFNFLLGVLFIYIFNILLKSNGLHLNINIFTGIFAGILGIPGIICLYILQILL
ncbi:pro-sigmaK processing inhibitor BofA family protein [[Clostridium] colinum]|uniref:pro-sigmaK processing inhibitor BofA family protein n=1 Tax=[Clostridium] colinum TaxID=36835 RepID=UPI002025279E|nr:pro-sigmaK processing inhibitor BofA family protein [[Clostridium] colinum]